MTKIILHDSYLDLNITLYASKDFNSTKEIQDTLKIKDLLYLSVVKFTRMNRFKQILILLFCKKTLLADNITFYRIK